MKRMLIALLLVSPMAFADDFGRFDPNTIYEPPAAHAPANVSRMYAKNVSRDAATLDLPASGDSGMIIWTIPARPTRLRTPSGQHVDRYRFDGAELGSDLPQGQQEVLHVERTEAALYHLDGAQGAMVVAAEPESALTLSTWAAPLSRQPGEPVTLHAELRDGNTPITGASVIARIGRREVELTGDAHGVYTATVDDLDATGPVLIRFEAEGVTARGVAFARTGSGQIIAERGAARLGAVSATVAGDMLHIVAHAFVRTPGNYRLDAITVRGTTSVAWGEGTRKLEAGAQELTLDVPLALVGTTEDLTVDVRLLGLDEIGVAGRAVVVLSR